MTLFFGIVYLFVGLRVNRVLRLLGAVRVGHPRQRQLLYWWHSSTAGWWLIAVVGVIYVGIGTAVRRSVWTVYGAIALFAAATHFSIDWTTGTSLLFTGPTRVWVPILVTAVLGFLSSARSLGLAARARRRLTRRYISARGAAASNRRTRRAGELPRARGRPAPPRRRTGRGAAARAPAGPRRPHPSRRRVDRDHAVDGLYGLDEALREFEAPIFGTCAGMIVLDREHLGLTDITVRRNAFGRQVHSFEADLDIGHGDEPVRAVFIRAPWIEDAGPDVEVLAEVDGHPVLARQGRILVAAFHPELTDDTRIHELFLNQVRDAMRLTAS